MEVNQIHQIPLVVLERMTFEERLDLESVSKTFYASVWKLNAESLSLQFSAKITSKAEVLNRFKRYCRYFMQKLPNSFLEVSEATVFERKKRVDEILNKEERYMHRVPSPVSLLDCVWSSLTYAIHPEEPFFSISMKPRFTIDMNEKLLEDPNEDIGHCMDAGIIPNYKNQEVIILQDWCSEITARRLMQNNSVNLGLILAVSQNKRLSHLTFELIEKFNCWIHYDFSILMQSLPKTHEKILHRKVTLLKPPASDHDHDWLGNSLMSAVNRKYSEKFVHKLLKLSTKSMSGGILASTVAQGYSETVINQMILQWSGKISKQHLSSVLSKRLEHSTLESLLQKYRGNVDSQCVEYALSGRSPSWVIMKLLSILDETLSTTCFKHAVEQNHSEELLAALFSHVSPDWVSSCFEVLIDSKRYQSLVNRELPRFLADPEIYIDRRRIPLITLMHHYSPDLCQLLIRKEFPLYGGVLEDALERKFPEDVISIILQARESVYELEITLAKNQGYSEELLKLMRSKNVDGNISCTLL